MSEARQKFTAMSAELHQYAVEHSAHRDELMLRLSEETERAAGEMAVMQTAPEQAALMTVLARAIGARRALELGTFTGFGSVAIARGLPEDGYLLSCDINEEWTAIARRYIDEAGLGGTIEVRLAPALDTLAGLPDSDPFDFAFIDADKGNYPTYYGECVRLLRPGGLVLIDNVFHAGRVVAGAEDATEATEAIRQTNDRVAGDERVISAMVGVADGLTVALKL